jgi:uncharacterized protein YkwD
MVLTLGLAACATPVGTGAGDGPGEPGLTALDHGYHVLQPRPWRSRSPRFGSYSPSAEQEVVDKANAAREAARQSTLFVASRLTTLAREQSYRMANRRSLTFTDEDRAAMKAVISPSSLPPRDWWVFINRVPTSVDTDVAHQLVSGGDRPFSNFNFFNLKPTFNALGVGVYTSNRTRMIYATVIVVANEAR